MLVLNIFIRSTNYINKYDGNVKKYPKKVDTGVNQKGNKFVIETIPRTRIIIFIKTYIPKENLK